MYRTHIAHRQVPPMEFLSSASAARAAERNQVWGDFDSLEEGVGAEAGQWAGAGAGAGPDDAEGGGMSSAEGGGMSSEGAEKRPISKFHTPKSCLFPRHFV